MRPDVLAAILAMAVAAFLCRAGGYFLMRYVPITPRVEVALRMIPMAIVASMLAVAARMAGRPNGPASPPPWRRWHSFATTSPPLSLASPPWLGCDI